MSELESKAVDILDKLDAVVTQYAPEVGEAVVEAVRITSIGSLISALILIILSSILMFLTLKWATYYTLKADSESCMEEGLDPRAGFWFVSIIGHFMFAILAISAICIICDIWVWVGIFNPKLALAHQITGL